MDSVTFVIAAGSVIAVATVVSGAALPVPEPVPELIEARLNVRRACNCLRTKLANLKLKCRPFLTGGVIGNK